MDKKYGSALARVPSLYAAAEALQKENTAPLGRVTAQVTAPVLYGYVWHVLEQAERMGLKRLYFLSRDGYVMWKIAQEIAGVCPVSLDLRYLYCSESSLRLPCTCRLDEEEGISLLLKPGGTRTLRHVGNRAQLTAEERAVLYEELSAKEEDERRLLSEEAYASLCAALRRSVTFRRMAAAHAREAYTAVRGYLEQEGLADGTPAGIVDAGWTSTVQRSLRRILDDLPPLTGFYFGLIESPKASDGVCTAWYFSPEDKALRAKFSRSVFARMCAAPSGAAIGYEARDGHYVPVLQNPPEGAALARIRAQVALCARFAALCAPETDYTLFPEKKVHRLTQTLLEGLMYTPSPWETEVYREFPGKDGQSGLLEEDSGDFWQYGALSAGAEKGKAFRRRVIYWQRMREMSARL